jgi:CHAT domain-containing protein/tetratricopeptide (TPR) repeat protein
MRVLLILSVIVLTGLPALTARAQTAGIGALMDSALVADREQRFEDAAVFLEQIRALPSFGAESYARRRKALALLGKAYGEQNAWDRAVPVWEELLKSAASLQIAPDQETMHINLGIVLRRVGRYSDADTHLKAAERLAITLKDDKGLAAIYAELLAQARELQVPNDIRRYEGLLASVSQHGGAPSAGDPDALALEAQQAASQNRLDDAVRLQQAAVDIVQSRGQGGGINGVRKLVAFLVDLGILQSRAKDLPGALNSYRAAVDQCTSPGLRPEAAFCALKMAEVYLELDRRDSAWTSLNAALADLENTESLANALYNIGLIQKDRGDQVGAAAAFLRAVMMFEVTRSNVSQDADDERRRVYMSSRIEAYEQCIGILSELRMHDSAFKVMELAQARTLNESLRSLNSEQPLPKINITPEAILKASDPMLLLDTLYQQTGGMDLTDVCARYIDRESALLEFFLGRYRAFVLVAHDADGEIVELQPPDRIDDAVDKLRGTLSRRGNSASLVLPVDSVLSSLVLGPVWPMVKEKSHLFVVPNGSLWLVPFETLLEPAQPAAKTPGKPQEPGLDEQTFRTAPFLVRRFSFTYSQSACILGSTVARPHALAPMLIAFADPSRSYENIRKTSDVRRDSSMAALKFASKEVRDIARYFPAESTRLFIGNHATEAAAKKILDTAGAHILHFATHGFLSRDGGRRVGLILDRSQNEDGVLESAEIAKMHLHSDVVVLSACETGLGERVPGEGTMGLARAFALAGARVVVVSLWEVADQSTSQLMNVMYQELRRSNGNVPRALHEAQQSLLSSDRTAAPFYWAPFIAIGQ